MKLNYIINRHSNRKVKNITLSALKSLCDFFKCDTGLIDTLILPIDKNLLINKMFFKTKFKQYEIFF